MSVQPPINLDYRPTVRPPGSRPAYLVSRLITSYLGYLVVMVVLVVIVPRFQQVYSDFKIVVPRSTEVLLGASSLCLRYYLWIALIPLPAMWAVGNARIGHRSVRRGLRLAAFIGVLAFLITTLFALFWPMLPLISSTSSPASSGKPAAAVTPAEPS